MLATLAIETNPSGVPSESVQYWGPGQFEFGPENPALAHTASPEVTLEVNVSELWLPPPGEAAGLDCTTEMLLAVAPTFRLIALVAFVVPSVAWKVIEFSVDTVGVPARCSPLNYSAIGRIAALRWSQTTLPARPRPTPASTTCTRWSAHRRAH